MKPKGKQMMAWLLTAAVTFSGNSFTVLADEVDFSDIQILDDEQDAQEVVTDESVLQQNEQTEEAEMPVFETEEETEAEESQEAEAVFEETEEMQDETEFSDGEEETNPEEYAVWFEGLRNDEYSTYFFDNEDGELHLNTENLEGKNASVEWKVGYRLDEQEEYDSFTSDMGLPEEMIFWSENELDNSSLQISGEKLKNAQLWLNENKGDEYWFEVRAYVMIEGEEEPAYQAQAGVNARDHVEDYQFPGDDVLLLDWDYWVNARYNCYVENSEYLYGENFSLDVTDIRVENAEGEEGETPVCEITYEDGNGWNIRAKRFGTAVVTLTYKDLYENEQQYSFHLYVSGDKFTLEPQWPVSGSNMLKNSEMKLPFVLRHEWRYSEEEQGSEEVSDWTLEFAEDENGWAYDTNLLDARIDGHELTALAKDGPWGTDVYLKATTLSEDGTRNEVAFYDIWLAVRSEYDVLYPENIENINTGEVLDLNACDLRVEHIQENEDPYEREDVTYEFEYDTNQWTNEAEEGQLPVLRRKTADGTQINVIARDEEENEICRREYWFDGLDYSVWFENLRDEEYSTYFFDNEDGELRLNTENLEGKNASVEWKVGYRTDDQNGSRPDDFTTEMDLPEEMIFWSEKAEDSNALEINGEKLQNAEQWLREKIGDSYWFEVRAEVKAEGEEEPVYQAQAGVNARGHVENYQLPGDEVLLLDRDYWVDAHYNCYVEDSEHLNGEDLLLDVTDIQVENEEGEEDETPVCEISYEDENGWNIHVNRFGTAVVTLTYKDIYGNEQQYSFHLYVNGDKYTLEPQWTASGSNMLKNSERKISFVLRHEWKYNDEEQGEEEISDWTLEFAEDENGWAYDTNLLDARIDGQELTISSKDETWGTDICLKAVLAGENGTNEDVTFQNIWIEVCDEYDVLYPENIENINAGDILDLNACDLKVEHVKENADPYEREDITYDVEFDTNQWTNEAEEGQLPVLRRKTGEGTQINVIARDENGEEICRREYGFDNIDYSVWFDNLREDGSTFVYEGERYELSLNTENLEHTGVKDRAQIAWEIGYTYAISDSEEMFETQIPEEYVFWEAAENDTDKLIIDGDKLKEAYKWLRSKNLENSRFEIYAQVEINGECVFGGDGIALEDVRENEEEYYMSFGATLRVLPGETFWIDRELEGFVRDKDHPYGDTVYAEVTDVSAEDPEICKVDAKDGGWKMKGRELGETTLKVTYTDYYGNQREGLFYVSVEDVLYWIDYDLRDNQVMPGDTVEFTPVVYRRTKGNSEKVEYKLTYTPVEGQENLFDEIKTGEDGKVTVKIAENADVDQDAGLILKAESTETDQDGNALWCEETEVYFYITAQYGDQIRFEKDIDKNPAVGEALDLNSYDPTILRYDYGSKEWQKVEADGEHIRFSLDLDESVWEKSDDSELPVLVRKLPKRTEIRLRAEEFDSAANTWNVIAESSYYFENVYEDDEECEHLWDNGKVTVAPTETTEGEKTYTCTLCGETKTEKINKLISVVWKTETQSAVSGEYVKLSVEAAGGSGEYTYKFIICDDKGNWYKIRDFESSATCMWKTGTVGKKTLYVDVKDSDGTVKRAEMLFTVKNKEISAELTLEPSGSAVSGTQVKLSAKATGGSGEYTYKFVICDDKGNWYKIRDFESSATCMWKTGTVGKKTLYVDVKDSEGTVKRAEMLFTVKNKEISAELTSDPSGSAVSGTQVKLSVKATGGSGEYTYKFVICDDKGNWYKIRDFESSATCMWKTGSVGKKTLYVDVKDSEGTVKRAEMSFTVRDDKEISAELTSDPAGSALSGTQVKLSAKATGGSGKYTYKFILCDDKGNWYKIRDFESSATCMWKTGSVGKKTLYVDVKDSEGTVKRAEMSFTVRDDKEISAELTSDPAGSALSGTQVKLSAKATGGSGKYTYKFILCDDKGNWYKIRDFESSATCMWKTGSVGKKTLYVDVKDSEGTVKRAAISFEVKEK
ncbi:hypothetical protein [Blautia sp. MSJ-19]|uniref:hypothetical protein n=1 Tax=Blautia sp. MSJ-19 TaxID=2841517 RepID=UPI001C0F1709|nr:hypothetical protein [Blautia sp. MSJ-19]MBU5480817.1 hypothetical protein [Blautia sp. MSJ-19]